MVKMGIYIARVHVDATWHLGPRGFATWTARGRLRGADVTCGVFIFTLYIFLHNVYVFRLSEDRLSIPYKSRTLYTHLLS